MQKLLSIIIPVYNVEAYIIKCLDSLVLNDACLMELFEVIIINDGTPDRSAELSRDYTRKYPRTFRQLDKDNGNYGSCVNRGLAEAQGKYIKVLDADDWFDPDQFCEYLRRLNGIREDIDLILTDFTKVSSDGGIIEECTFKIPYNTVFSFQEYEGLDYFAHHALTYRTNLLREHQYKQTERISYTDNEWVYYPQLYVDKCVYWDIDLYRYMIGREGQTMNPSVRMKRITQVITILKRMVSELESFHEQGGQGTGAKRLSDFILHTSIGIYNTYLVKVSGKDFPATVLKDYDEFLLRNGRHFYESIGDKSVLKGIPVHYVKFWRKFDKRFPVDFFRTFYRRIKYGSR